MTSTVGIGIVNRDGRDLLLRCLEAVAASDWPLDVVVVDNASSDGSAEVVRQRHAGVRVIETGANLGFAGGANRALRELRHLPYAALVNNDAVVAPGWLRPLVEALEEDSGLGAAAPKILFDGQFLEVPLDAVVRAAEADRRPVGLRLSGVRVDGRDEWPRAQFLRGWYREEAEAGRPFRLSSGPALLRTPVGEVVELEVDGKWRAAEPSGPPVDVVNNAGSLLVEGGFGADRGFQEVDTGQYDEREEVFAWCGAAVLLRRSYVEDVGGFDERLFLYYEDLDLAWRGRARGWRYLYVPESVVRHVHTASSVEGSALFDHYVERNRLLVHVKNAPARYATRVALDALRLILVLFRREVVRRALFGEKPDATLVKRRLRSFAGFLLLLPLFVSKRRRLRRRQQTPYKEQMRWLVPLPDLERDT